MSEAKPFFSVTELAAQLAVKDTKILGWIANGELQAFNVASRRGTRPRWRISQEAFTAFQAARSAVPIPKTTTRRQRPGMLPLTRKWIT